MSDRAASRTSRLSDQDLMRRVQADDTLAFEELYDRYCGRAFSLARVICDSTEVAQDAVQDGFLSAWRNRARYDRGRGSPQTWLLALVRNRSIDNYRRHRNGDRLRTSDEYLHRLAAPQHVEDDALRHDEGNRLRASLQQLPARQREVIVLAYFGGLTHTEIGTHLDLPLGTVKGRMRHGLLKLVAEIESPPPQTTRAVKRSLVTAGEQRPDRKRAVPRNTRSAVPGARTPPRGPGRRLTSVP